MDKREGPACRRSSSGNADFIGQPFRCPFPDHYFNLILLTRQYLKMDLCILCDKSLQDGRLTVGLRQKGCVGINEASKKRGVNIRAIPG